MRYLGDFTIIGMFLGPETDSKTSPSESLMSPDIVRQVQRATQSASQVLGAKACFDANQKIGFVRKSQVLPATYVEAIGTHTLFMQDRGFGGTDCNGCCGGGCSTCTGVYTNACLAHDNCVSANGYFAMSCNRIFPAAVASTARAVGNGGCDPWDDWCRSGDGIPGHIVAPEQCPPGS